MENCNLAAIDIGSNAARLLIKGIEIDEDGNLKFQKILFLRIPLRLGMDVFYNGKISEGKKEEFIRTMKAYRQLMKVFHVRDYRACATSAMRDADNGKDIIDEIFRKTGIRTHIISGDEESQIIYDNHIALIANEGNFLYVDVGGGSTEVTFICNGERLYSRSFNVGTLRMLNGAVKDEDMQLIRYELKLATADYKNITIIGSGGNINKLHRISRKNDKGNSRLPVETLRKLHGNLAGMTVAQRMETYGFKPDRADVIVPAAEIFLTVSDSVGASEIMVPCIGLADGLIFEMAEKAVMA